MYPSVTINTLNKLSGETKEIERHGLFVGVGEHNVGKIMSVTPDSDFDKVFGEEETVLKRQVMSAMRNAGQNWFAHVAIFAEENYDFCEIVRQAQEVSSFEFCVNTYAFDITKSDITKQQDLFAELVAKFGRRTFFMQAIAGINNDEHNGESWDEYVQRLTTLQNMIVAHHVCLVPMLFGNDIGALAGRLCKRSVTIADSPCRVKTGALLDLGSAEKPTDKEGTQLNISHLKALEQARYSTANWYPDYDGFYWSDGRTLDVEGGDYQVIEYVRVADKAARKVRLLAISKIADRSWNSTPASEEFHKNFFAKPIRDMSKGMTIGEEYFPGECMPPKDNAISITWFNKNKVGVGMTIRPYDCPKDITVNIILDLETLGE